MAEPQVPASPADRPARCVHAEVTTEVLDPAALAALVDDPRCGAVVTFAGVVRNHDEGRGVVALAYSAHPTAQGELAAVVAQFADVPGIHALAVAHRIGDLAIGDIALAAAVAGEHRAEAFATMERLITEVKARVPIWKHQHFSDGTAGWTGL
ncbi:molybdenum cofactor biosynthesis protein MoaE [Kribbia dieselivorans]|uniref:molybdenum cofactor biosynthesis protein MoaE n=1 Tax=Kribbia dieselivorans TaxID=331526 RepID=UPI001FE22578|nr:molybdenum cofactor biosynthesis protein MoaE [Kribbia dieselivorans]